jgi:hypothetical protein
MILLFHMRRDVKSCWSCHIVELDIDFFLGLSGKGGSSETLKSFSGVTERWISNKSERRHRRSHDARLSKPLLCLSEQQVISKSMCLLFVLFFTFFYFFLLVCKKVEKVIPSTFFFTC